MKEFASLNSKEIKNNQPSQTGGFEVDKESAKEKDHFFDLEERVLKINQLENEEKKAEEIKHLIKNIIQQYKNQKMDVDNLENLLKDLADVKDYFTTYYYNNEFEENFPTTELSDHAYSQEEIDFLISSFENNIKNCEGEQKELIMDDFNFIMSISTNNWKKEDSVSDLFIKNTIALSKDNQKTSDELEECQWRSFARSRFKIKEENYFDFLIAMVNDKERSQKYVSYISEIIRIGDFNKQSFRNKIKNFNKKIDNYFVNKLINRALENPFENVSIDQKRDFLEEHWDKLNRVDNFYDTLAFAPSLAKRGFVHPDGQLTVNDLNDRDVEIVFKKASFKERGSLKRVENQKRIEKYALDTKKELLRDGEETFGEETVYRFQPFSDYKAVLNKEGKIKYFEKEGARGNEKLYTVEEVLEQEGYKQKLSDDEFDNLVYNFEFLTNLSAREEIEDDLKIDLSKFNIRELFQFITFLSTKNQEDIVRIRDFFSKMNILENSDYLRTFLSLEIGQNMGNEILLIGEKLEAEDADKIFSQYAQIIDSAEEKIEEFYIIYKDVFSDKEIDKNKIRESIVGKGAELLKEALAKIQEVEEEKKSEIIKNLISDLKREDRIKTEAIENLRKMLIKQNTRCTEIEMPKRKSNGLNDYFINTNFEQSDLLKSLSDEVVEIKPEDRIISKFSSDKIKEQIKRFENSYRRQFIEREHQKAIEKYGKEEADEILQIIKKDQKQNEISIMKLKNLLKFQIELEKQLNNFIYNENSETENPIFQKYQEIIDQAKNISKNKIVHLLSGKRDLSEEELDRITDKLLERANSLMSKEIDNLINNEQEVGGEISSELKKIDSKVVLLGEIIKNLPKEEVAELDLSAIKDIEKIEDLPSRELLKDEKLLSKILPIIDQQFPDGSRKHFLEECQAGDLKLMITKIKDEPLCFFSKKTISEGIEYLDWFISNPKAPIKGLGEATVKYDFYRKDNKNKFYYAVAKPHVKSFEILIEKLGFVAFDGCTEDGEYDHHYSRCRNTPDNKKLTTKNFTKKQEALFKEVLIENCSEFNNVKEIEIAGEIFFVVKTKYSDKSFQDDITKKESEGWLMREIDRKYQEGYVLSRFIPGENSRKNETFYVVFEKDQINQENRSKIENYFHLDHQNKSVA